MKRLLFLTHRWLGLTLGLLVLAWFASGVVMMYVGFPQLTALERCSGLAPLPSSSWRVPPAQSFKVLALAEPPEHVRLGEFLGRPVYHIRAADGGSWRSVFADDGQEMPPVTAEQAVAVARRFANSTKAATHDGLRDYDQWTVSSGLNPLRPFHRVALADAAGTEFYISAHTGEVVRDTACRERLLNYVGAVTHWVYPTWLRRHGLAWRVTMRIFSGLALLLPLTGLWLAAGRLRGAWRTLRGVRRGHVLLGTASGLFAVTWLFSGFLSLRVTAWFDDGEPTREQAGQLAGGPLQLDAFQFPIADLLSRSGWAEDVKEAELVQFAGRPFLLCRRADTMTRLVPADTQTPALAELPAELLSAQATGLLAGQTPIATEMLTAYDAHYYSRRPGEDPKPLPILRARFADAEATWFHLDPHTGQLTERLTRRARAYRWLFNALHSLDWPGFAQRRPLWDITVITLLGTGFAASATGLTLAIRRFSSINSSSQTL